MFGDHGLGGLPEESAHEKSPKCLDGNLGDFGEFCKGLGVSEKHGQRAEKIVCPFEEYRVESTAASGCQRGVRPEYKRNCIKGGS